MLARTGNEYGGRRITGADGTWMKHASIGLLALALTACSSTRAPSVTPQLPVHPVDPETWQAVDRQIATASMRARHAAEAYARVAMEEWLGLVRQQTEDVFIPWYLNYWTQQWIGARVAWHELQHSEGEVSAEERLVTYLQEQFYEQVLAPVSSFTNPRTVMGETLADYLRQLEDGIDWLPFEYQIPLAAFDQHLDAIPAIVLQPKALPSSSLREVLQADDLESLPAFATLLAQVEAVNDSAGQAPSSDRLRSLAGRAVAKLTDSMPLRGGAVAASTLVGGPLGAVISVAAASWGVVEHDRDRPAMERQLRISLDVAFVVVWQELVEDDQAGVLAPVHHLSTQIERAVAAPVPEISEPAVLF